MDSYGGFLKWGYPQIIYFNRTFHYTQSILGYPHSLKPPHWGLYEIIIKYAIQCFSGTDCIFLPWWVVFRNASCPMLFANLRLLD